MNDSEPSRVGMPTRSNIWSNVTGQACLQGLAANSLNMPDCSYAIRRRELHALRKEGARCGISPAIRPSERSSVG